VLDAGKVDAAALPHAERILESLVGGHREGHEWKAARKAAGGPGDSLAFNLTTGQWAHFGGDGKGPGLVSFYAYVKACPIPDACTAVAGMVGYTNGAAGSPVRVAPPPAKPAAQPAEPIPAEAGMPPAHRELGAAQAEYAYHDAAGRLLFVVCRYALAEHPHKTYRPWTWRRGRWANSAYPAPRPLYGLLLALRCPGVPVLVVEGEKSADAANAVLTGYTAVSWAEGAKAVRTADWTPLAGRAVDIWPDADEPGLAAATQLAAILLAQQCTVRVLDVAGQPDGWDIADAVAEGVHLAGFMAGRWRAIENKPIENKPKAPKPEPDPPVQREVAQAVYHDLIGRPSASLLWQLAGIIGAGKSNDAGVPYATVSNIASILRASLEYGSELWHDDFRRKNFLTRADGTTKPWDDDEDLFALEFIQHTALLHKATLQTVVHAVQLVAARNRRNSVQDWLRSLTWDGVERIDVWTSDFLGTPNTIYEQAVGRNWLLGMVARAMQPGCEVHHMPVLEGSEGAGKSRAIKILGSPWHRAITSAFGGKEFQEKIQGVWLVEIPDLSGFSRKEHGEIISFISTPEDAFRVAYGRHAQDYPRTAMFAATSNTSDYLKDWRGIRRFLPLKCGEINLEALQATRDQLFAEAMHKFSTGSSWHELPLTEARAEQRAREEIDIWLEDVAAYVEARAEVSLQDVARYCLNIETARQTQQDSNRIAKCLRHLGFYVVPVKKNGRTVKVYRRIPE
jgi:hypothetical protein